MKNATGLATEEMQACPDCGELTFEVGPCFRCSATKPRTREEIEQDIHARNVLWHEQERTRIAELERKAAAYDAVLRYRDEEKLRPWSDDELKAMTAFAKGYRTASLQNPAGLWIDTWETFADDIDIHFLTNGDEQTSAFGAIEAWGYRRNERPEIGDRDCTDEVKLI